MEKRIIKNRNGEEIHLNYMVTEKSIGFAIVQHGLGGFKEQLHVEKMAQCLFNHGYSVVNFDCRHAFGESAGDLINCTLSSYVEDLETVITAFEGEIGNQKIVLAGHSLGGGSILSYAVKYPEKIKACAPLSTIVSGERYKENKIAIDSEGFGEWKKEGSYLKISKSKENTEGWVSYQLCEDMQQYDFIKGASNLTMPCLLIVGDQDDGTPYIDHKDLYDAIPHKSKELHVINECGHTFKTEKQLEELENIFSKWLSSV